MLCTVKLERRVHIHRFSHKEKRCNHVHRVIHSADAYSNTAVYLAGFSSKFAALLSGRPHPIPDRPAAPIVGEKLQSAAAVLALSAKGFHGHEDDSFLWRKDNKGSANALPFPIYLGCARGHHCTMFLGPRCHWPLPAWASGRQSRTMPRRSRCETGSSSSLLVHWSRCWHQHL